MGLQHPPDFAKVLGRKMIRLNDAGALKFMTMLFPCAKFLLTYRIDIEKQMQSGMWKKGGGVRELSSSLLHNETRAVLEFHAKHPDITFAMPLENITVARYNAMLYWLGARGCVFDRVLLTNANLKGAPKNKLNKRKQQELNNAGAVDEQSVPILAGECEWFRV
jgi:hypothetical protein